jgi:heme ABC exporter ATP-binding subunit CcmA
MITIRGLRVVFGRTVALDSIDVDLAPGVTGLFGQNASGKSTLLRVLAGLLTPDAGSVAIQGRAIDARDEDSLRRIGYVGHESGLYGRLTVRENLELFARLYGTDSERVGLLLDALGLNEREAVSVRELSAGFKRRASVARALMHEPELLLLDEPYANLDDDAAALVSSAVQEWRGAERIAVIATHGAKIVKAFADGGVILKRGRVVVAGSYRRGDRAEATS